MVDDPHASQPHPNRRALLAGGAAAVGASVFSPATAVAAPPSVPTPRVDWVRARGHLFDVGGRRFAFAGTNTYYLHQSSHYMIDAALNDAAAMSLAVVRAWAFADGSGQSYTALQPAPHEYDDEAMDSLDYSVFKAGQLGLRLVLALTNNWPDYGGMQQYVKWFLDLPDDSYGEAVNHDKFYSTEAIRRCYRDWAAYVIERRNPYTGLRYNEDPTIMAFELANEPRNRSDKTGRTVLAWADEMSRHVKSLAPNQLVAVGDEGFYGEPGNADYPYSDYEGNRWRDLVALPGVDYATVHLYPQHWGERSTANPVAWGTKWIEDHIADGVRLRKPVVIEEYGLEVAEGTPVPDHAARTAGYGAWTRAVRRRGAGDQFWLLTSRVDDGSFYPDYDGYRIVWENDERNPTRETAQLLSEHAREMYRR